MSFDGKTESMIYYLRYRAKRAMSVFCERAISRKAFATPWEVCFNVAYPPPQSLKTLIYGAWCLVPGAWCLVPGAWCRVLGAGRRAMDAKGIALSFRLI